ncbi:MAG: hypothetical protein KDC57_14630 [Saprospiraceae bacterium]|nr:hypothetical protein [Saprospiraceae bacterium]
MTEQQQPVYIQDDEITLKDLILKIQEFWRLLWSNKWYIIAFSFLLASLSALRTYLTPSQFPAKLTFMVNEDEGSNMGGIASVLGQFGLSSGGKSEYNLDRILELSRSRRIIYPVLLDSISVDGKSDLIANHLIRIYDFHDRWEDAKDPRLPDYFFTTGNEQSLDNTGRIALNSIYIQVVGNEKKNNDPLMSNGYGEETAILNLNITALNPELAIGMVTRIYDILSTYYIEKSIEPQQEAIKTLRIKSDSLKTALANAESRLARFDDSHRNLYLSTDVVQRDQYQRQVSLLTIMYGEVIKNLETASFALQSQTPFFQTIDEPQFPILPSPKSLLKAILIGGLLGGFLSCGFFISRKIYRDAMAA